MKNDVARVSILFHNRAGEAMLSLYRDFKRSAAALDRQWDENVFQQLKGKYTSQLKRQLEGIALELMGTLERGADRNEWNYALNRFIQDYLMEFGQRIRAL